MTNTTQQTDHVLKERMTERTVASTIAWSGMTHACSACDSLRLMVLYEYRVPASFIYMLMVYS